jgi:2-hydroxychromene-2-carboxylate isomerase
VNAPAAPWEFGAPLTVCVDFRSPHAYLAIAPTRALEARLGVAFDWLPFEAPPLYRAPPPRPDDDRGARHRRARALYFERDLERYANARGLVLGALHRETDTTCAAAGLLWLRERTPSGLSDYVERVFDRVWRDGRDVADAATIAALLGLPASAFDDYLADRGRRQLAALRDRVVAAGVFNVPTYVARGGEVFVGRQHLPLLEALLRTA